MIQYQADATAVNSQFDLLYKGSNIADELRHQLKNQSNKYLYIGITVSILLHVVIGQFFLPYNSVSQPDNPPENSFNVTLFNAVKHRQPEQQEKLSEKVTNTTKIENIKSSSPVKPTEEKAAEEKTAIEKTTGEKSTSNKAKMRPNQKSENKIILGNIYENLSKEIIQENQPSEFLRKDFVVMDPKLRKRLDEILREQKHIKRLSKERQVRKDNKYFEYASYGGDQIVRVNGNCFKLKQDLFQSSGTLWLMMGSCKKSRKLDFKTRKLDQEYLEGR